MRVPPYSCSYTPTYIILVLYYKPPPVTPVLSNSDQSSPENPHKTLVFRRNLKVRLNLGKLRIKKPDGSTFWEVFDNLGDFCSPKSIIIGF